MFAVKSEGGKTISLCPLKDDIVPSLPAHHGELPHTPRTDGVCRIARPPGALGEGSTLVPEREEITRQVGRFEGKDRLSPPARIECAENVGPPVA